MYAGFATHTGQRRQNQDNALIDQGIGLFAVADGVGGGDSGEVASASVCFSLQREVANGSAIEDAIRKAHHILVEYPAIGNAGYAASTIVVVQLQQQQIKLAWVGDSRIYLLREGILYQLSEDHSVVQQIAGLSELDMRRMRHVLTQAVGIAGEEGLCIDSFYVDRHPGDCWLLCSDGLHGVVTENEITQILGSPDTVDEKAEKLLSLALANGADDNVTLIVLQETGDYQMPPESAANNTITKGIPPVLTEQLSVSAVSKSMPGNPAVVSNSTTSQTSAGQPWHYIVLGGVLAALLFFALVWGL